MADERSVGELLDELFGFGALAQAVEQMTRTLSEHFYNRCHALLTEYPRAQQSVAVMAAGRA